MSSLYADREIHRSGTGVLTIGKEIGYDESKMADYGFDRSPIVPPIFEGDL